jgi:HlyD family secretion protein
VKTKWKVTIGILVLLLLGAGTLASVRYRNRGLVEVQTGMVTRGTLISQVSASGEIKPRTYTNLGANAQGRIVELMVTEGQRVRKGQIVARIESVQAEADVEAQRANVAQAEADAAAAEVGLKVQDDNLAVQAASIERARAQLALSKTNFERVAEQWEGGLIARQEYDRSKNDYEQQQIALREAELRLQQMRTQRAQTAASIASSQRRVAQAKANLERFLDILAKHDVIAPLDGVVTNLPVRIGETVVPGVQNSAASAVMTIADMSLITAEVRVDETDIVNVKLGQAAEVSIDAISDKKFSGKVIEIGNSALLRSSGAVASSSATSSSEAKDFKVVVALDSPPEAIRPGLSCTVKITTATHEDVLHVPIQALTVRQKGDLEEIQKERDRKARKQPAPRPDPNAPIDLEAQKASREEVVGVFVIENGVAEFRPVETGISGATNVEITKGLDAGQEVIIGGYQVIRTLRPGTKVTVNNRSGVAPGDGNQG